MSFLQQWERDIMTYDQAKIAALKAIGDSITAFNEYTTKVKQEMTAKDTEIARLNAKWIAYEQEYILPCFKWAEEYGINLHQMVRDNPGHNCVELLVRELGERSNHAK